MIRRPVASASSTTLEAALMDTGRPILVAPPAPLPDCGNHIAVAWEGSPEAARAVNEALPLLAMAQQVTILACETALTAPLPASDLLARLGWHGIRPRVHEFAASAVDLGAAFLERSAEVGADMLIKGAYSQSRLRQLILGARTRHILAHAAIPVLLAH